MYSRQKSAVFFMQNWHVQNMKTGCLKIPDERMIGLKENSQKTDRKGTGIMKENRYELNKQLAQMLKGRLSWM